ncbi:DUF4157 domain-containing protein [Desulfobacter curvatus]|uniref:eCIS core domain-containing protein n=1 Tax=Desulfobacter curvatus TaxID=2290 RepID=UPI0012FB5D05|nr:DUF4157 domain-containing protein [Desulfobacter curvatus]
MYEQEADQIADQVMSIPDFAVQNKLGTRPLVSQITPLFQRLPIEEEEEPQTKQLSKTMPQQLQMNEKEESRGTQRRINQDDEKGYGAFHHNIASIMGGGISLPSSEASFFESRFGCRFARVRIHTDSKAAEISQSMNARAFTVGDHIAFARSQYQPETPRGRRLLAHELAHVVQQSHQSEHIQCNLFQDIMNEGLSLAEQGMQILEREAGAISGMGEAAAREIVREMIAQCNQMPASACPNADCPPCFCSPLPLTRDELLVFRDLVALYTLPGIAVKVSPRVVPLWEAYLYGGTSQLDLSGSFGNDFMRSQTTVRMNSIVTAELSRTINPRLQLPNEIDIPSRIPTLISQMNNSTHTNAMDFNVIGEIPGNIAGGIGQQNCSAGARPSTVDDRRDIEGSASIVRNSPSTVTVFPNMFYVITDTIDLCPGNCGADIEQIATLPMSWLEASGVSGDVPFIVRYHSALPPFVVSGS